MNTLFFSSFYSFYSFAFIFALGFAESGFAEQRTPHMGDNESPDSVRIDTTSPGIWLTAPIEFIEGRQLDMKPLNRGSMGPDWKMPPVSFEELSHGVSLSRGEGPTRKTSLLWKNHPRYPTIMSHRVPRDWSNFRTIELTLTSERSTGEIVSLGIRTNDPKTPTLNYWTQEIAINWTGERKFIFQLDQFEKIGNPQSWSPIEGIYFFTKNKRRSPSPFTVLHINSIALLREPKFESTSNGTITQPNQTQPPARGVLNVSESKGYPVELNHPEPEIVSQLNPYAPLIQQPFFLGSRALHGYYPRYNPGYVSFDPEGKAYIRSGSKIDWIDWMNQKSRWHEIDLSNTLENYAKSRGWKEISVSHEEPMIRFDQDGDVYVMVNIDPHQVHKSGFDWHARTSLLLHAKAISQSWTIYELPGRLADFEKIDTFNSDALKHPPVILLTDYNYFRDADHAGYLLLPEKKADGSLILPPKIKFTPFSLIGPVHSGGGNFAISRGNRIYVVYGYAPPPGNSGSIGEMGVPNDAWVREMPPIPLQHPAKLLTTKGIPSYVVEYDRLTKKLGQPVFVGYGGNALDGHNWPAMTIDREGRLHVVMNGHINPLMYTHTIHPGTLTEWSPPVYIKSGGIESRVSYASLSCNRNNQLVSVVRSDTNHYNHRISVLSKSAVLGSEDQWNPERSLVVPYTDAYHVWHHRVTVNPVNNRYYAVFSEINAQVEFTRDEYLFSRFIWPDYEKNMTTQLGKQTLSLDNKGIPAEDGKKVMFNPGEADFTVFVSDDSGKTWRLAISSDFTPVFQKELKRSINRNTD